MPALRIQSEKNCSKPEKFYTFVLESFYERSFHKRFIFSPFITSDIVEKHALPQIDEILDVLKNGKWHDLKEISEKTKLHELKVELLANFLAEYDFIELDKKEHKTRLKTPLLDFLRKVRDLEKKERRAPS